MVDNIDPVASLMLLTHPNIDPNVGSPDYGPRPIMVLLLRNYNNDIKRDCLRAMVESNKVDLEVKNTYRTGLGLVLMAW